MIEPQYYLGIDAGGTKTHALIADQDGVVLGIGRAGTGNWERAGLAGAGQALTHALDQALAGAGLRASDLCAAGYGLAGLDWPSDEARLAPVIDQLGVPGPRALVNDAFAALSAGSPDGSGVVVIAGTGGMVAGRNHAGARFRSFGLGLNWGEVDGATTLVAYAQGAVVRAYLGHGPPTALTERLLAHYGAETLPTLLERLVRGAEISPDPRLAPLVFDTAAGGDSVAQALVRSVGNELGQVAAAVVRRLGLESERFDLVLAGGLFRAATDDLRQGLLEPVRACAPDAQPVLLRTPPVAGSAVLAMQAAGIVVAPKVWRRLGAAASARFADPPAS